METEMKPKTKAALLLLADQIETVDPKNFNMGDWAEAPFSIERVGLPNLGPTCGTSCCIAGWHQVLKGRYISGSSVYSGFGKDAEYVGSVSGMASEEMGLSYWESEKLFYPWAWPRGEDEGYYEKFPNTPKGAAARIRYFVETGE